MNTLIKTLVISLLSVCAISVWVGMMLVGFAFSFTSLSVISHFTPIVGLISVICIIRTAISVYKSNPAGYVSGKIKTLQREENSKHTIA